MHLDDLRTLEGQLARIAHGHGAATTTAAHAVPADGGALPLLPGALTHGPDDTPVPDPIRWSHTPGTPIPVSGTLLRFVIDVRAAAHDRTPSWQVTGRVQITPGAHPHGLQVTATRSDRRGTVPTADVPGLRQLLRDPLFISARPSQLHDHDQLTAALHAAAVAGDRARTQLVAAWEPLVRATIARGFAGSLRQTRSVYDFDDAVQDGMMQLDRLLQRFAGPNRPAMSLPGAVAMAVRSTVTEQVRVAPGTQSAETGTLRAFLRRRADLAGMSADDVLRAYALSSTAATLRTRTGGTHAHRLTLDDAQAALCSMLGDGRAALVLDGTEAQRNTRRRELESAGIVPVWSRYSRAHVTLAMTPDVQLRSLDATDTTGVRTLADTLAGVLDDGYDTVEVDDLLTDWLQSRGLTDAQRTVWHALHVHAMTPGEIVTAYAGDALPAHATVADVLAIAATAARFVLDADERRVWELVELQQLRCRDVAELDGRAYDDVRRLLRTARRKARRQLADAPA
jgi:DNA-directed RNA polymerase specialized sigma24 family protein